MTSQKSTSLMLAVVLAFSMLFATGCFTHQHVVGDGAQTGQTVEARQWYVLWGLVPISEPDTQQMAGGAEDYTITTETTALDFIIGVFTGAVTVYPRSVVVEQ